MENISLQLDEYDKKLESLNKQCAQAEKDALIAENNLEHLTAEKEQLIQECEQFAGVSFDKIPDIVQKQKTELDAIMSRLSVINFSNIDNNTMDAIHAIINDFNINIPVTKGDI